MQRIKYKITKRVLSLLSVMIMLSQCLVGICVSAEEADVATVENVKIGEMVCRIKNAASGLYLDSYRYTLKTKGKSYLENHSENSLGQVFHLSPCEDGTYMIVPQNDNGEYAYSYSTDSSDLKIKKVKLASAGDSSKFDIVEYSDGRFMIAPSNAQSNKAVLSQSATVSEYKDYYAEIAEFTANDDSQLWIIEPIKTEKLTVVFTATKVRLYSTGTFYARKHPYNVITDDIVWTSSNDDVLLVGDDGTWCALGIGTVEVTASVDGVSKSFTVNVVDRDAFTWYSQNNIYTSDWDATQMLPLYFYDPSNGVKRKFAVDSKDPGGNYCWMDEGCGNCAVAMVLNNMGAVKTTGYDFRSGQVDNLVADPYTVGLANSGQYGSDITTTTLRGNPIYMRWQYVVNQFSVDGKMVELTKIYNPSRTKIKNILAEHPEGVVVQVSRGTKNHYLVFAECANPEEKVNSKLKFIVCDSAAYLPENGDYVPFEESTSYKYENYRYSNIVSVMYFTVSEE